jgi:hypothetical protein
LFGVFVIATIAGEGSPLSPLVPVLDLIESGVASDPLDSIAAFLVVAVSVAVAGVAIFLIDRRILTKAGLEAEQARRSAMWLAVLTAPYLYFVPSRLIY